MIYVLIGDPGVRKELEQVLLLLFGDSGAVVLNDQVKKSSLIVDNLASVAVVVGVLTLEYSHLEIIAIKVTV